MDPVLPTNHAVSIARYNKALYVQHRQLQKADLHLQFITTCLRKNTIPRGLQISTQPLVPKPPCQKLLDELNIQWEKIVRRASTHLVGAEMLTSNIT